MEYLIDTSTLIEAVERRFFDRLADDPRIGGIVVMPAVFEELDRLAEGQGRRARAARAAASMARQTLKAGLEPAVQSHVDDALLELASAHGHGIISQDHALITRAKERGLSTLTLKRSGKIGD